MQELTGDSFDTGFAAMIGRALREDERLAVAVSGGADSLALLLLAHEAFGARLFALTVDHGLRAGSSEEAAGVAAICAARGIAHATLLWKGDKPGANLQANARAARYRLMGDWCAANGVAWLATAHHADDQAETLLMRAARGAGLGGLAGIRRRRPLGNGVTLIRPLLDVRKEALGAVVTKAGLAAVDDPTNRDPRHDRTAARALLRETSWLDAARLSASAGHLADAEAALSWTADIAWQGRATIKSDSVTLDAVGLPRELQRRLIVRALASFDSVTADGPEVDRLLTRLRAGDTATLGMVKAIGGALWHFTPAPPRRSAPRPG